MYRSQLSKIKATCILLLVQSTGTFFYSNSSTTAVQSFFIMKLDYHPPNFCIYITLQPFSLRKKNMYIYVIL